MKYKMRKVTEMMREMIKVALRNVVEKSNNVGICITRSGIIEKTMIFAISLVSTSIVIP
jgi:hypothetical protein